MVNYFWKKASGLNADIARHTYEEEALRAKIAELEASDLSTKEQALRVYRNCLHLLLISKAEVTSKIGR